MLTIKKTCEAKVKFIDFDAPKVAIIKTSTRTNVGLGNVDHHPKVSMIRGFMTSYLKKFC